MNTKALAIAVIFFFLGLTGSAENVPYTKGDVSANARKYPSNAGNYPSIAGFFPIANQGRQVWNFNPEWRFHLGDAEGAGAKDFDDSQWEVVNTPHCVKLEPAECSGGRNYQGIAWYRKNFVAPANHLTLYFEAIMGKQDIYINGTLAERHYGGYLPIIIELDKYGVKTGDSCVVAVKADNSDDKSFPPGKPQPGLDFCYHGGIYRDVWLISKNPIHITDPIEANRQAGGGVFVHYDKISDKSAEVYINVDVFNGTSKPRTVTVENVITDKKGKIVGKASRRITICNGSTATSVGLIHVSKPNLWSPESPYLYTIETRVKDGLTTLDGGATRIGIRSFEFRGKDGFWLNGKRYRQFVGANRHQDFAYVGNAVPNSQQWRDALRLKDCGFNIIRTAHYPQDPAFMDACDELGLFIIVATPGWQFWNKKDSMFEKRVYQNTRDLIRRDRNHPSVLMWEPILNETRFPEEFSMNSLKITRDEYPYPYRPAAAADMNSAGVRENYDVVYGWPGDDEKADRPKQCIFTREFGEYVDDWYAHNNLNRASRSWGERPMLLQALSLAKTTEEMYRTNGQFIGGAQWHPFDHQRGYHPDPYWGGDFDAFRQPKTVYWFFKAQNKADMEHGTLNFEHSTLSNNQPSKFKVQSSPMVHIAHEMTQFSDSDVVVFSNCDSVRLSIYDGAKSWILPVRHTPKDCSDPTLNTQFSAPVVFHNVWNFWEARDYSYRQKAWQKVNMVAEGIINGKVVCSEKKMPSRRSTKLRLYADEMGENLIADGSDFIVVVCEVTDDNGNVRRLAKENIRFTVTGEGHIIGDNADINANPRAVEWGSAPILVQSTQKAGNIHIHAEVQFPGTHAPEPADLDIVSVPSDLRSVIHNSKFKIQDYDYQKGNVSGEKDGQKGYATTLTEEQKQELLKEVEQQQADFGISSK